MPLVTGLLTRLGNRMLTFSTHGKFCVIGHCYIIFLAKEMPPYISVKLDLAL